MSATPTQRKSTGGRSARPESREKSSGARAASASTTQKGESSFDKKKILKVRIEDDVDKSRKKRTLKEPKTREKTTRGSVLLTESLDSSDVDEKGHGSNEESKGESAKKQRHGHGTGTSRLTMKDIVNPAVLTPNPVDDNADEKEGKVGSSEDLESNRGKVRKRVAVEKKKVSSSKNGRVVRKGTKKKGEIKSYSSDEEFSEDSVESSDDFGRGKAGNAVRGGRSPARSDRKKEKSLATGSATSRQPVKRNTMNMTLSDFAWICKRVDGMCVPIYENDSKGPRKKELTWKNFFPAMKTDGTHVYVYEILPWVDKESHDEYLASVGKKKSSRKSKRRRSANSGKGGKEDHDRDNGDGSEGCDDEDDNEISDEEEEEEEDFNKHPERPTKYKLVEYSMLRKFFTGQWAKFPSNGRPSDNRHIYNDAKKGKVAFVYWTKLFVEGREKDSATTRARASAKRKRPITIEDEERDSFLGDWPGTGTEKREEKSEDECYDENEEDNSNECKPPARKKRKLETRAKSSKSAERSKKRDANGTSTAKKTSSARVSEIGGIGERGFAHSFDDPSESSCARAEEKSLSIGKGTFNDGAISSAEEELMSYSQNIAAWAKLCAGGDDRVDILLKDGKAKGHLYAKSCSVVATYAEVDEMIEDALNGRMKRDDKRMPIFIAFVGMITGIRSMEGDISKILRATREEKTGRKK